MGLRDALDHAGNALKDGANNVKDTISEAGHRSAAEGEQAKREVAGDQMTVGENVGSMFNQGKETIKADIDAGKRDVRNNT